MTHFIQCDPYEAHRDSRSHVCSSLDLSINSVPRRESVVQNRIKYIENKRTDPEGTSNLTSRASGSDPCKNFEPSGKTSGEVHGPLPTKKTGPLQRLSDTGSADTDHSDRFRPTLKPHLNDQRSRAWDVMASSICSIKFSIFWNRP